MSGKCSKMHEKNSDFNPNPGYQKYVDVWLGVIFDFQATNRKEGRYTFVAKPLTSHLGSSREPGVHASYPLRVHKNSTINRWFPMIIEIKTAENAVFLT
jgi:hypothetical protein